jgi:hypothetical protein
MVALLVEAAVLPVEPLLDIPLRVYLVYDGVCVGLSGGCEKVQITHVRQFTQELVKVGSFVDVNGLC